MSSKVNSMLLDVPGRYGPLFIDFLLLGKREMEIWEMPKDSDVIG